MTIDVLTLVPAVIVPAGAPAGLSVDGDGRVLISRAGVAEPAVLGLANNMRAK